MLEAFTGGEAVVEDDAPPPCAPDDKKPSLSVEELEAKQGNITHISRVRMFPWTLESSCSLQEPKGVASRTETLV